MTAGELPKQYQAADVEQRWSTFWAERSYFRAVPEALGEPYCIAIPPPNVTGALHMGHGLDETIQDTITRFQRMRGKNVLWVPGTDHAGIATQTVVAEKLARAGRNRRDMGREAFVAEVWKWKEEHGNRIVTQLKRLGCSCDWSREAFTLDEPRARAVRVAFKRLFDKGLIYRGEYLVNWDPVSLTALSDDEVDYEDEKGHLWHLRYPIAGSDAHRRMTLHPGAVDYLGTDTKITKADADHLQVHPGAADYLHTDTHREEADYIVVATTRPETMLGDTAVAVNPTDERWSHLIGKNVILPLMNRPIPIIADDFVKKDFGTGVVKITPGHDPNDFLCGQRHRLPMINVMTDDAKINENGGKYAGLDRYEARERVVADMKALGLLEKVEPHDHRIGRGYRSKAIIEPRLSKQWFVKIEPLAKKALAAVESGDIRIIPESPWRDIYRNWMVNVRDWCISRQLWWGHRIPIWYKIDDPATMICHDGEGAPPEVAANPSAWRQDEDVLDTWFSSALWPASILGWPDKTADLAKWYPTNVLVTGHDILFFWVARMIMFGLELVGERPFRDVYLHGLIFGKTYYENKGGHLAVIPPVEARKFEQEGGSLPKNVSAKWEKMSKSKGNVIDPIDVIDEFGTDALRLTVGAYAALGRNIDLDWRRFESYRNFVNKLWNASRFVLMTTQPLTGAEFRTGLADSWLADEDAWILSRLTRVIESATANLEAYEFDKYVETLYQFVWNDYCDWYLEIVKQRFYGGAESADPKSARVGRTVLLTVLEHICRLLHPVMPFATEEIWQTMRRRLTAAAPGESAPPSHSELLPDAFAAPSLCVAAWPAAHANGLNDAAEAALARLREIIGGIRNIRGEMKVPLDASVSVSIETPDVAEREILERNARTIRGLANAGSLVVASSVPHPPFASTWVSGQMTILVELPAELVEKEKERLRKELAFAEKGLVGLRGKLANEGFTAKAPPAVVEQERAKMAKLEADVEAMKAKLHALGS